ncbi:TetR/AcrR family transcriptional regulator [Nocardia donostiensis]|uniref:TetR family transcriptional regulator n=1 Tax=Nocardia donostiensis TaxID=1538463 RepID=A0A1W0AT24_9NOCA|nr:TetR/AcrR family transcriptional regulator [Nocardia donostiensis]ONM49920.1 TetR family transcriptional regulator [Nocardia donostiensis]OQS13386.1 TetR family transcriptional regulator [Nocardia donostiensis]OQS22130.1 TetR family transcriptional regulator [Nocardia donostiensis]
MSQKEQLLAGARACLIERGYAHTTARDIAAASGANLASIGYHFGSKDALLNAAVVELVEEWGDRITGAVEEIDAPTPTERLEEFVRGILAAGPDERKIILASVQAFAQAEFIPEIRDQLQNTYTRGRVDLSALVLGIPHEEVTDEQAATVGSVSLSLINGAVLQWLLDPVAAAGAARITDAVRTLSGNPGP